MSHKKKEKQKKRRSDCNIIDPTIRKIVRADVSRERAHTLNRLFNITDRDKHF